MTSLTQLLLEKDEKLKYLNDSNNFRGAVMITAEMTANLPRNFMRVQVLQIYVAEGKVFK